MTTPCRRLVVVIGLLVVPWLVVLSNGEVGLTFAWGLVNPDAGHVTSIVAYLFVHTRGLPDYLLAWPIATLLHIAAIASAVAGLRGREDPRLTGGLLFLVGLSLAVVARGISRPSTVVGIPIGTIAVWIIAWWLYWPAVREPS